MNNNSQSSEFDMNDVFNYNWKEAVSIKSHKLLIFDNQNPLSKASQNEDTEIETNEANEVVLELPHPIIIKRKIQNYQIFCEKIKNITEPTDISLAKVLPNHSNSI